MKIAYAGFDLFYPALEALYDSGCEIVKIFSCSVDNVTEFNTQVTDFARAHSISITYDKITTEDLVELRDSGVDALFCAAYYYRMPIIDDFKMLNIHPSLLPMGRGSWPMPVQILRADEHGGVSIHKMEESFDTGEILMQKSFEIAREENLSTFMDKIYALLPDMIDTLVKDLDYYYSNATAQSGGEYLQCPDERDYIISIDSDFDYADRVCRAFYGFYIVYDDGTHEHHLRNFVAAKGDNENVQYKIKGGYLTSAQ